MSDASAPPSFAALLARFPDLAILARTMGLPHPTVTAWKRRGRIPEPRWRALADAARALKVRGVTYSSLSAASLAMNAKKATTADNEPIHGD